MFERLYKVIDNVRKLDSNLVAIAIFADDTVQKFIIDLNRIEQLFKKGVDANDKPIGFYSEVTDIFTQGETFSFEGYTSTKRAGNHYTLLDTGYFYSTFEVHLTPKGFTIEADDQKENEYLTDKYGLDILGLSQDSKDALAREIIGKVILLVRAKMLA